MMPFHTYAGSIGGWSLGSPVASGASAIVNGTKEIILNGASKIAKGTAKITPNPSQVAKVLARGAAGYALSVAVEQLLGAVDWVLDPANNQIVYTKPSDLPAPNDQFLWIWAGCSSYQACTVEGIIASTPSGACQKWADARQPLTVSRTISMSEVQARCIFSDNTQQDVKRVANPAYDPEAEDQKKTLPLETVAQQVISNAAGGDVSAQQAITAAAQDVINEAENDSAKAAPIVQQLEASKAIEAENTATGEQTQNPANPNVTNIKLEFPAFCGWAPTVCEAAQTVISFPRTLTNWWNTANQKADSWANSISQSWAEAKEWATSETSQETEIDIQQETEQPVNSTFNFSKECPASIPLVFGWNGGQLDFTFNFSMLCDVLSTYIYPIVVALGGLHAVYIVSGVRRDG